MEEELTNGNDRLFCCLDVVVADGIGSGVEFDDVVDEGVVTSPPTTIADSEFASSSAPVEEVSTKTADDPPLLLFHDLLLNCNFNEIPLLRFASFFSLASLALPASSSETGGNSVTNVDGVGGAELVIVPASLAESSTSEEPPAPGVASVADRRFMNQLFLFFPAALEADVPGAEEMVAALATTPTPTPISDTSFSSSSSYAGLNVATVGVFNPTISTLLFRPALLTLAAADDLVLSKLNVTCRWMPGVGEDTAPPPVDVLPTSERSLGERTRRSLMLGEEAEELPAAGDNLRLRDGAAMAMACSDEERETDSGALAAMLGKT